MFQVVYLIVPQEDDQSAGATPGKVVTAPGGVHTIIEEPPQQQAQFVEVSTAPH